MRCNICEGTLFADQGGRRNVRCLGCGSLERSRLLWLHIERLNLAPDAQVLHIAPEKGIYRRLRERLTGGGYVVADFDPDGYGFAPECRHIDLTDMEGWPSDQFDLILHSHVMEHIPCTLAYPLYHLHRMLRPSGRHLCVIPFMGGYFDECYAQIGATERNRRFGQADHVRRFGREDKDAHIGKLLNLPTEFDATADFDETVLREANIPEVHWRGWHLSTVLDLAKEDYRLK